MSSYILVKLPLTFYRSCV